MASLKADFRVFRPIATHLNHVQVPTINAPYKLTTVPVAVASHCHTDTMVQSGVSRHDIFPLTASHEGSGTVAAVGSAVTAFRPGDRVLCGITMQPCGDCTGPDESRRHWYCAHVAGSIGVQLDGCFAELRPRRPPLDHRRPRRSQPALGSGLGHLACRALEVSRRSGAGAVVDAGAGTAEVARRVRGLTGGEGAAATPVLADAEGATALGAAIAQPEVVAVPFQELVFRDMQIRGSLVCAAEHGVSVETNPLRGLEKIWELLALVEGGNIQGKAVIIVDLEQIEEEKRLGAKH
ncbi:GroES-like protein [Biscogniauxia marginata]|nr:GroES-like protein [Biscogniauxia marginata]